MACWFLRCMQVALNPAARTTRPSPPTLDVSNCLLFVLIIQCYIDLILSTSYNTVSRNFFFDTVIMASNINYLQDKLRTANVLCYGHALSRIHLQQTIEFIIMHYL